jgi:hypothetical protein
MKDFREVFLIPITWYTTQKLDPLKPRKDISGGGLITHEHISA